MGDQINGAAAVSEAEAAEGPAPGAAGRPVRWFAILPVLWFAAFLTEGAVPGLTTSQVGSAIIAGTVFAGLAAWTMWGIWWGVTRMLRNVWRSKASCGPGLCGGAIAARDAAMTQDDAASVDAEFPAGWSGYEVPQFTPEEERAELVRSVTIFGARLALIVAGCWLVVAAWAWLVWVLVIAAGVVLGVFILAALARA